MMENSIQQLIIFIQMVFIQAILQQIINVFCLSVDRQGIVLPIIQTEIGFQQILNGLKESISTNPLIGVELCIS